MRKLSSIKTKISQFKTDLREQFGVKNIEIFGSYVRGEQKKDSDLDVLVEFSKPVSLLDVVGLENFLSDMLHIKVDVVLKRSVRPELKEIIFHEAVPV